MNKYCYEDPTDPSSRKLDVLRQGAAELTAGFLNGYEGQEVVIIDELPQNWAEAHRTLKTLMTWMDNYEGTINVKTSVVPKRVWRWILISNYSPVQVFSTVKKDYQANAFGPTYELDMAGTYEPLGMRITNMYKNSERCMMVTNMVGNNPSSTNAPTKVVKWDWFAKQPTGEEWVLNE